MVYSMYVKEASDVASSSSTRPAARPAANTATGQDLDHYAVDAAADPGVLPRAVELLAKRGLAPVFCTPRPDGERTERRASP